MLAKIKRSEVILKPLMLVVAAFASSVAPRAEAAQTNVAVAANFTEPAKEIAAAGASAAALTAPGSRTDDAAEPPGRSAAPGSA